MNGGAAPIDICEHLGTIKKSGSCPEGTDMEDVSNSHGSGTGRQKDRLMLSTRAVFKKPMEMMEP